MLSLRAVAKEYDLRTVLSDVSLSLRAGEACALIAPNGSGKTTLLHIMAGLSRPTRGQVRWLDGPMRQHHRKHLGVVVQQPWLYGDLTAAENLALYAGLYGCPAPQARAALWLKKLDMHVVRDERARALSKGFRQRLSLARALIHEPDVLLLDEPFDGLDVPARQHLQTLLAEQVASGRAVFLITHHETEAAWLQRRFTLRFGQLIEV